MINESTARAQHAAYVHDYTAGAAQAVTDFAKHANNNLLRTGTAAQGSKKSNQARNPVDPPSPPSPSKPKAEPIQRAQKMDPTSNIKRIKRDFRPPRV